MLAIYDDQNIHITVSIVHAIMTLYNKRKIISLHQSILDVNRFSWCTQPDDVVLHIQINDRNAYNDRWEWLNWLAYKIGYNQKNQE